MKLNSLLNSRTERKGMSHTVQSARVCVRYDQIMAEQFSEVGQTEALKLERGVLKVSAQSPAQASFLRLQEDEILQELNQYVPEEEYTVERLTVEVWS
ncbi:MAG: DciA family protein [Candidatus Paceibacteria bacterium]